MQKVILQTVNIKCIIDFKICSRLLAFCAGSKTLTPDSHSDMYAVMVSHLSLKLQI